jgi:hypothetical protein
MSGKIFLPYWPESSTKSWQHWQQGKEKPAEHICYAVYIVIYVVSGYTDLREYLIQKIAIDMVPLLKKLSQLIRIDR